MSMPRRYQKVAQQPATSRVQCDGASSGIGRSRRRRGRPGSSPVIHAYAARRLPLIEQQAGIAAVLSRWFVRRVGEYHRSNAQLYATRCVYRLVATEHHVYAAVFCARRAVHREGMFAQRDR